MTESHEVHLIPNVLVVIRFVPWSGLSRAGLVRSNVTTRSDSPF